MDFIMEGYNSFKRLRFRDIINQAVNLGMIVATALMIWKGLQLLTGTESPIVVVLSGSMEPAFYRGDVLFLYEGQKNPVQVGDILVYQLEGKGKEIPIVHRVIRLFEKQEHIEGERHDILTKGDANHYDDRSGIYNYGQKWLHDKHVLGRVMGYVPYVGMVTIIMNDYPILKYVVVGGLGIMILLGKD